MRRIVLLMILSVNMVIAQNNFNNLIEYKMKIKSSGNLLSSDRYFLLMDKNTSFGFEYRDNINYQEIHNNFSLRKSVPKIQNFMNKDYLIYSIGVDEFMYFKDDAPKIKWTIMNDSKDILGYRSQKAVGAFRGREYTVWFTPEIPYSYGPWKLKGLPGLILESIDDKKLYSYKVDKINLNTKVRLPSDIEERWLLADNIKPFKLYVKWENNRLKKLTSKLRSSYPKGTEFLNKSLREMQQELTFEWEE